ncbi:MAG TPA: TetR/AcrR family transcriptional regulator [Polyangiaceae bacterium]|nr:TetR/AcrR family transcriptional regulator [Polyangiaceae bacterium]
MSRNGAPVEKRRTRLVTSERRAQLLALGLQVFASRSYDEVSMEELATRAGISKGLVYHYFPTKRHFYVAALREAARQLVAETETDDDAPPSERLQKGLFAYLTFVERHARAYTALMRGGVGSDKQVAAVIEQTRGAFVERLLAAPEVGAAASPRLRLAARGWIGFVEATALEWIEQHEITAARSSEARARSEAAITREDLIRMWMVVLFAATGY